MRSDGSSLYNIVHTRKYGKAVRSHDKYDMKILERELSREQTYM